MRTFSFFLSFFRAVPVACGSSPARGRGGATAADLHQSHSNARSELHLQPIAQLNQVLNPLSKARDQTCILMNTSWVLYHWPMVGNPLFFFFLIEVYLIYDVVSFQYTAKWFSYMYVLVICHLIRKEQGSLLSQDCLQEWGWGIGFFWAELGSQRLGSGFHRSQL